MSTNEPAATAYLRFVLKEMGISATELAKRAGVAATTLTRPLNDPGHKFTLTTKTISRIAEASGISPGPFFSAPDLATASLASVFDDRVYDPKRWGEPGSAPGLTAIVGEAEAGAWREPEIADVGLYPPLLLRSSNYEPKDCFGLVMRGRSLEKIANDGDVLFCVRLEASGRAPIAGDVVIVERRTPDDRWIEVSARVIARGAHGPVLHFASRDYRFVDEIPYPPEGDDKSVKIIGEVLYVVRAAHLK
ncbi:helix-turn-helix domain-containing protein [Xanthobacter aminoxidans]|uniref:Helix-turn-helix transcriptional regulator n=1 Tax=Xanthobacter aminoxidans TaxID=186280 RepID=A0ABW6ZBS8_9HYPH